MIVFALWQCGLCVHNNKNDPCATVLTTTSVFFLNSRVGNAAGKRTVALLTRMDQPLGRRVGNWLEVEQAHETLRGHGSGLDAVADLIEVTLSLAAQMLVSAGRVNTLREGMAMARKKLEDGSALGKWLEMVDMQGGDIGIFGDSGRQPRCQWHLDVVWSGDAGVLGCVATIDALEIGLVSVRLGAGREQQDHTIDNCAGIELHRKVGEGVAPGDALATLHSNRGAVSLDAARDRMLQAFVVVTGEGEVCAAGKSGGKPLAVVDALVDERGEVHPWGEEVLDRTQPFSSPLH